MASRTIEQFNNNHELKVREFYCMHCSFFCLTPPTREFLECPSCFEDVLPNEDFIIKDIQSLDQ